MCRVCDYANTHTPREFIPRPRSYVSLRGRTFETGYVANHGAIEFPARAHQTPTSVNCPVGRICQNNEIKIKVSLSGLTSSLISGIKTVPACISHFYSNKIKIFSLYIIRANYCIRLLGTKITSYLWRTTNYLGVSLSRSTRKQEPFLRFTHNAPSMRVDGAWITIPPLVTFVFSSCRLFARSRHNKRGWKSWLKKITFLSVAARAYVLHDYYREQRTRRRRKVDLFFKFATVRHGNVWELLENKSQTNWKINTKLSVRELTTLFENI